VHAYSNAKSAESYALFDCMIDKETGAYVSEDLTFAKNGATSAARSGSIPKASFPTLAPIVSRVTQSRVFHVRILSTSLHFLTYSLLNIILRSCVTGRFPDGVP
jgi:hypothetical protein